MLPARSFGICIQELLIASVYLPSATMATGLVYGILALFTHLLLAFLIIIVSFKFGVCCL
jgi:hypothetical protein